MNMFLKFKPSRPDFFIHIDSSLSLAILPVIIWKYRKEVISRGIPAREK